MNKSKTDVLVIGAGPAGSIAAATIQQAGFSVRVVEREKFPRFVIGESLLPRCMDVLEETGMLGALKQKCFQEKFGAKFMRGGSETADYNFSERYTEGWTWTWQVPRAEFDTVLATELQKRNIPVHFETTVTDIRFFENGASVAAVQRKDGTTEEIEARFIVDASGYGRVIPRLLNLNRPATLDPRKAVFAHVNDVNRSSFDEPDRIIILIYAPAVWVWIIPFSNGVTSLGFVANHDFFIKYGDDLNRQFTNLIQGMPYLKNRFGNAPRVFRPRTLESWSSVSEKFYGNGYVLTGNVTEFLDPVFSSGVMFATVSGHLAGKLAIRHLRGEAVDWQQAYTNVLQKGVDTFRSFVDAWYDGTLEKIFFTYDPDPLIKSQITSVLAGYVWDENNPFVKDPGAALKGLVKRIEARNRYRDQQKI